MASASLALAAVVSVDLIFSGLFILFLATTSPNNERLT